ncbi:UvrD-helicase domain-containing protein [Paenibacillus pinistramenti]|uniref:UvrD-helicase domain-containing protein n=1 Tax=Paenibacillus pinistramenti TaxID=1768003 RepID=UPI001108B97A|nr:UvrD-helicase domain-containing protein [Paenibacillus pinistramenti]
MEPVIPKPAGSYWSDDQWNAITLSGGNMLVAAAAGSGKTAVLVERIIRKISDPVQPVDIERLMVATFTKAAAAEMRHRIREALEAKLENGEPDERLQRQLAMLGRASITTLHSFCMEVIQRYYTMIPLDPGFRIASEHEAKLLRQETLEELFEEKYGSEDGQVFFELVEWFSGERSDDAAFRLVQRLFDFSRSHPWPDYWLRSMADSFAGAAVESLESSLWVQSIIQDTLLTLDGMLNLLSQGKALSLAPGGPAPYAVSLEEDMNVVLGLQEAVLNGPWSGLFQTFQSAAFGKLKPVKKDQTDPAVQERVKALREEAKKSLVELQQQLFGRPAEAFAAELHAAAPLMSGLAELVIEFGERYREAKAERGWLDFSDLEHYCLRILLHPDSTPLRILPSDAALEYQAQFEEVLLDEYQDTNTVQETIVRLISRPGAGNRFMVGDVKQSIYRFRLAEPGLFLEKYRGYGDDFSGEGLRIDLARNFRSRREVVGAVNMLFRQIMNRTVAEIDYDDRAELIYGNLFPAGEQGLPQYEPELMLIDRSGAGLLDDLASGSSDGGSSGGSGEQAENEQADGQDNEEAADVEAVRLEARAIAARIRGLLGEGGAPLMVYDKNLKGSRPAVLGDIVILLRSTSGWAPLMIQELQLEGIPAVGELNQGYFQAAEVENMLSLLQIIDNPNQDIPLAAVLRSPIVGLDEEDLSQIRLASKSGGFYEALLAWMDEAAETEDTEDAAETEGVTTGTARLYGRLNRFMILLQGWRNQARGGQLSSLIWTVYRQTSYLDFVGGLAGGPQRQANLQALYNRAEQFEQTSGTPGLFRFLKFIDKLKENGGDLGAPSTGGGEQEAVRIMTIHKSKGLEFPVVFVAGLSKMFNRQDLNAPFLMHKELGFGPKYVDSETRVSYPTLPNLAIRRRSQMELIAEEMRILYVALTRPKDKLILVSAVKDLEKAAANWGQSLGGSEELLPDYLLARGRSYMDWIGPALIRHPSAGPLRELAGLPAAAGSHNLLPYREDSPNWQFMLMPSRSISLAAAAGREDLLQPASITEAAAGRLLEAVQAEAEHEPLFEEVSSRLEWQYPYGFSSRVAAKTTVTELKARLVSEESPAADGLELQANRAGGSGVQPGFSGGEGNAHERNDNESRLQVRRPRFMEQKKMSGAERGTAYHVVFQHLRLQDGGKGPLELVEETFRTLEEKFILLPEQLRELDRGKIAAFINSELGQRLRDAEWVKKEQPFTYGMPAAEAYPHFVPVQPQPQTFGSAGSSRAGYAAETELSAAGAAGIGASEAGLFGTERSGTELSGTELSGAEFSMKMEGERVIVQGIIDCLFKVDGKLMMLDYKSDFVPPFGQGLEELKERYRIQLELYSRAVEQITKETVAERWLYFVDSGDAVQV